MATGRPAALCSRMYDFYELKVLGRTGAEYSRLLATGLLSRTAISGDRSFKLELELQSTDTPNDYVAFYNEGAKEWWLIQAEHSLHEKKLTWDEMFSEKQATGDVSMVECFRTFLRVKQHWRFGGAKVKLFVFTNRPLHESVKSKDAAVDELIKFSIGRHVQLLPAQEDTQKIAKHVNCGTVDTVKTFFSDLVLLVAQPNIEALEEDIRSDWRRWMKSWIRPDVFCRLTAAQLSEPFVTFKRNFQEWEQPTEGRFLTQYEGAKCLKSVERELRSCIEQLDKDVCVDEEKYYANRWITVEDRSESIKRMHDDEFVEWLCDNWSDQQQCIALFAEPGMGKSTLWHRMASRMQQSRTDVEVCWIYLSDLEDRLPMVDENANVESAVNVLGAMISKEHVKPLMNKRQKAVVFMDAFDVLKGDHKQSMINFVKVFEKDRSNLKFLINSRECCKEELVKCLQVKSINVVPFDENDYRDFLRSLWRVEEEHYTKLDAFLNELLSRFDREPPRGDIEFTGLPLTTKMLAEVFLESFRYSTTIELDTLLSTISIDELYVYEKFIATSVLLTLNKKWQLNYGTKRMLEAFREYIEGETENYQLIAMQQMKLEHLFEGSQRARLQQFYKTIPEEPLLLETVNGSTRLTHRTYAEYLCAKFLLDKLSNSTGISTRIMKDLYDALKHHVGIRRFFLKILDVKLGETQNDASHNIQNVVKNLRKMPDDVFGWASDDNYANLLSCVPNADESSSAERGDEKMKGNEGLLQRISCFGFRFR